MPHATGEVDAQPFLSSLIETNRGNMIDHKEVRTEVEDGASIVTSEVARNDHMKRDAFDIDSEQYFSEHLDSGSTSTSESFIETDIEDCIAFSQSIDRVYERNLLKLSTEKLNPMEITPLYPKDCILKKSSLSIRWASPLAEIKEPSVMKADEAFGCTPVTDRRSSSSCSYSDGKRVRVTFVPAVACDTFLTSDACKVQLPPSTDPLPFRRTTECNKTQIFFVPSCDSGDDLSIDCDSPIAASHSEIDPWWTSKAHRHRADERVHVHIAVCRHHHVGLLSVLVLIAALCFYSNAFLNRCSVSAHMINFIYSMMDVETRIALQRHYNRRDVRYRRIRPTFLDANQNAIGVWLS